MSAPTRPRIDDRGVAPSEPTSDTHGDESRRAYYAALGRMALQNMRDTLGWCVNTLRLTGDRHRRDAVRNPHEH